MMPNVRATPNDMSAMSAARSVLAELGVSRPIHSGELTGDLAGGGEWTATVIERGGTDFFVSYDIALDVRLGGAEVALDAVRTLPVGVKR